MYRIISLSQGRTKKGERFSNRKGIGDFFEKIERYDANLIRFHFFFFFSFSRGNARKQFWRNFRAWIIHGQLLDAWAFSCKLFNNLENQSILSTFCFSIFDENSLGRETSDACLSLSFFPFLLRSIPVIRIIKFDRERVAQIRWNYFFFTDRVLIRLLVPARTNFHECCRVFWTIYACNVLVTGLKPILRWKFQPRRRSMNSIIRHARNFAYRAILFLEDASIIYNITTHNEEFINNLFWIVERSGLERSLIWNSKSQSFKSRSSFIPLYALLWQLFFFSTHRSSSSILSSIF